MSKSPWAIANFWFRSEPGGMEPSCTSPGMLALRTMAGGGGAVDVVVAVVVAVVAVVDVVSVVAVVSVLAGISFLHATASASRVIVANFLMLSPLSNQTRNVR